MPPSKLAESTRPSDCAKCGATRPHIRYEYDLSGEYWVCMICGHTINVAAPIVGPVKRLRRGPESAGVKL